MEVCPCHSASQNFHQVYKLSFASFMGFYEILCGFVVRIYNVGNGVLVAVLTMENLAYVTNLRLYDSLHVHACPITERWW